MDEPRIWDIYAALAMLGLMLQAHREPLPLASTAAEIADQMMAEREKRND